MNDGGLSTIFLQNLPVLVVVLPLLLAVIAAVIPAPRAAWGISVVGIGGSLLAAILLQSITESVGRITYHLGNWEPPWGIEFVVDSATSLTLVIMTGLALILRVKEAFGSIEEDEILAAKNASAVADMTQAKPGADT